MEAKTQGKTANVARGRIGQVVVAADVTELVDGFLRVVDGVVAQAIVINASANMAAKVGSDAQRESNGKAGLIAVLH